MIKLNAILTIITMITLANADAGAVKLVCWLGLFAEFIVFTMIFEKDLQ